jgi:hypothetical protein
VAEETPKTINPIVRINGKNADLRKAMPLTIGDWKKLEAEGITAEQLKDNPSITKTATFLTYILHKANPEIFEADVDTVSLKDPQIQNVFAALAVKEVDIPFSTPSTS